MASDGDDQCRSMEREMDCKTLVGAAKSSGLPVSMAFDPYAEAAEAWIISIGEHLQGRGETPEAALNRAIEALEARDREPVPPR